MKQARNKQRLGSARLFTVFSDIVLRYAPGQRIFPLRVLTQGPLRPRAIPCHRKSGCEMRSSEIKNERPVAQTISGGRNTVSLAAPLRATRGRWIRQLAGTPLSDSTDALRAVLLRRVGAQSCLKVALRKNGSFQQWN